MFHTFMAFMQIYFATTFDIEELWGIGSWSNGQGKSEMPLYDEFYFHQQCPW